MDDPQLRDVVRPSQVRCAIYTRKSTEEGLEQEFNTLMAQREAAEAYIASQREQGWTTLPGAYDDGGFSGGNMDRPGLKRLLADIEAGRVDCVVVYKVDRLSRSLLDFARIMSVLDSRGVSFVSVTQQFNTSAPLGRLTLHILLSFAQFEREIIGERTRDKLQASRRKGQWTGGHVPLGYDLDQQTGRLVVNEPEAACVRQIFQLFLDKKSLIATTAEINHRGWTTKAWTTRKQRIRPGKPFRWPTLRALLSNVLYAGLIRHKDQFVAGQQPALIELAVFEAVGAILKAQERGPSKRPKQPQEGLLQGLLYCHSCGAQMKLTYTKKPYGRVRYYACGSRLKKRERLCPSPALSADIVERLVLAQLRELQGDATPTDLTIGPAYVTERFERIAYDASTNRLVVRLRQPSGHGGGGSAHQAAAPCATT